MYATSMDEMFNAMFGSAMGGFGGLEGLVSSNMTSTRSGKSRDAMRSLTVTLEDLYMGKTTTLDYRRTILCTMCSGTGRRPAAGRRPRARKLCTTCRGRGTRMSVRQMGIMIQQMQTICEDCNGTGEGVDARDLCGQCKGQKTEEVVEPVTVTVERGMSDGQRITIAGMASVQPGDVLPGDLIVVLAQTKHDTFERKESHLMMKRTITLEEALCGFEYMITHLDGHQVCIRRNRGEITTPGSTFRVAGEGMPTQRGHGLFGNLIIEFNVTFPSHLTGSQIAMLRTALPPPLGMDMRDSSTEDSDNNVHYVYSEPKQALYEMLAKEEEDDDPNEGPTPMACAQQ